MPYSEAQKRATNKYRAKMYDTISCTFPKGTKDILKTLCEERGISMQEFIRNACEKEMREWKVRMQNEKED